MSELGGGGGGVATLWSGDTTPSTSKGLEAFLHRDWQNVQENVKGAFFFLAAVLQEQAREINALKQMVADRPSREQVSPPWYLVVLVVVVVMMMMIMMVSVMTKGGMIEE